MKGWNPQPKPEKTPKKAKKPIKRTAIKYKPKNTGQISTFEQIAAERPWVCFVCNVNIPNISYSNMAHVLSKKQYPNFIVNADNIVILCHQNIADKNGFQGCHFSYDMTPHSKLKGNGWERLFTLRDKLKEKYNKSF